MLNYMLLTVVVILSVCTIVWNGSNTRSKTPLIISHDKFQPCDWPLLVYVAFLALRA